MGILSWLWGEAPSVQVKKVTDEELDFEQRLERICQNAIERTTLGAFHVDHIIPFNRGGGYERDNLQVTHPACNQAKGNGASVDDLVPYLERKAQEML